MSCTIFRPSRWPGQRARAGQWVLRSWLVIVVAMLGLGTAGRPPAEPHAAADGYGMRAGPNGPAVPGELPEEPLPLRGEGEGEDASDAKDGKDCEDASSRRAPRSMIARTPRVDPWSGAVAGGRRSDAIERAWSGLDHRGRLHNRGPPRV